MTGHAITVKRSSAAFARFPHRGKGYDVIASHPERDGGSWLAGHAVKIGRQRGGWIVLDPATGEVILGAGASTRLGLTLGDALFMFEEYLSGPPTCGVRGCPSDRDEGRETCRRHDPDFDPTDAELAEYNGIGSGGDDPVVRQALRDAGRPGR